MGLGFRASGNFWALGQLETWATLGQLGLTEELTFHGIAFPIVYSGIGALGSLGTGTWAFGFLRGRLTLLCTLGREDTAFVSARAQSVMAEGLEMSKRFTVWGCQ